MHPKNLEIIKNIENAISPYLLSGNIDTAAIILERLLQATPTNGFNALVQSHFTNPAAHVLDHINDFLNTCRKMFDIRAAYFEMNGFEHNYDKRFFDSFAYYFYIENPEDDPGWYWLTEWESPE